MKRKRCCLVPFGLLAVADGFGSRFTALSKRWPQHQHDRLVRGSGVSMLAGEGVEEDRRIDSDPDALEEWVSRMGGGIGPVVLEGE